MKILEKFLEIKDISFGYKKQLFIIKNLSLSFNNGDKILILASKDMGKSTLLSVLSSFNSLYSGEILFNGKELKTQVSVLQESRIAMNVGVQGMHDISRGGVFSALWELAEKGNLGIEVDLKKIPMRQETIEICEVLGVNPYELYGAGSLLMASDKGNEIIHELEKLEIPATIIGKITEDNGKVLLNGEEVRFLDRPKNDSIEPWLRDED